MGIETDKSKEVMVLFDCNESNIALRRVLEPCKQSYFRELVGKLGNIFEGGIGKGEWRRREGGGKGE